MVSGRLGRLAQGGCTSARRTYTGHRDAPHRATTVRVGPHGVTASPRTDSPCPPSLPATSESTPRATAPASASGPTSGDPSRSSPTATRPRGSGRRSWPSSRSACGPSPAPRRSRIILDAAGKARNPRDLNEATKAAECIIRGEALTATSAMAPTFEAFAKEWTSGELRKKHPDHVREKKDPSEDIQICATGSTR